MNVSQIDEFFPWYKYPTIQATGILKMRPVPPSIIHTVAEEELEKKIQKAYFMYLGKFGQNEQFEKFCHTYLKTYPTQTTGMLQANTPQLSMDFIQILGPLETRSAGKQGFLSLSTASCANLSLL